MEVTLSFPASPPIRLFTGDPRAHRILLLALAANGLGTLAERIAEGGTRAVAIENEDRDALGRAVASWLDEI